MPAHAEARTAKRVFSRQLAGLTPPDLEQAPVLFPGSEFIVEHRVGVVGEGTGVLHTAGTCQAFCSALRITRRPHSRVRE